MTPGSASAPLNPENAPSYNPLSELLQQIPLSCHEKEKFLQSELLKVQVYPERSLVLVGLKMSMVVSADTYSLVRHQIKDCLQVVEKVVFDVHYAPTVITPADYLAAHEKDLIFCLIEEAGISEVWLTHYRMETKESILTLKIPHEMACQHLRQRQCQDVLRKMLKKRCGAEVEVKLEIDTKLVPEPPPPSAEEPAAAFDASRKQEPAALLGCKFADQPRTMDVTEETTGYTAQGEIILYETFQTRRGHHLVKMTITDYSDSLDVWFLHENDGKFKGGLKERDWVRVRGDIKKDKYAKDDLTLNAKDILKVQAPEGRKDTAQEKRVELHCHTQMSRMDGLSRIDELIERAAQWGHPAIAITDHGVVQAYPDAKRSAKKHGIKLILGMEGYLVDEFRREKSLEIYHVILLVRDKTGLKNLYQLVSESHLKYFYKRPLIPKALLQQHREGLLVGSACEQGEIWQHLLKKGKPLEEIAPFYDYLEIQPCSNNEFMVLEGMVKDRGELENFTRRIYETGKKLGKPVVATDDSHYLDPRDEIYRKILHAGMGYGIERQTPLFFKTTDELMKDFEYLGEEAAKEIVVTQPRKLAEMIGDVEPLPDQTLSPILENADALLRETASREAQRLYGDPLPEFIEKRLQKELSSIIDNKFSTLYVIAMKLVKKSLSDGYIVGSRGSVGSSFVAFLCGITEVNPLAPHWRCAEGHGHEFPPNPPFMTGVDLPAKNCPSCGKEMNRDGFAIAFEVFMGFHGDKMPDIDLNFSGEYQHEAHKYVEEIFGKDHCFRAGTISAVKDKIAFGFVKKYMEETNVPLRNAEVNRLVKGCSGVSKTTGQHPGGIVILPQDMEITDICPVQYPADNKAGEVITTHFDYDSMHDCLVKLDILGHDNPTSLKRMETMTEVRPAGISLSDPKTMSLFSGNSALNLKIPTNKDLGTLGVPEFGTPFAMDMLRDTRPKKFEDLVRLCGLAHGTNVWLNNAQDLIKKGTSTLSSVISTRDDMLSDLVAKGMEDGQAFKIMEDVRKGRGLKPEFEKSMRQAQTPSWYIESCRKIKYIFPKAHAVAYCIMSFRIAWFKVHHPLAFYADYFTNKCFAFNATIAVKGIKRVREYVRQIRSLEKPTNKEQDEVSILDVVEEMYARGYQFLPVNLYLSDDSQFKIEESGNEKMLRPPLIGLPDLGEAAATAIKQERKKGVFLSVEDLVHRCGINKTVVEILKNQGCLKGHPLTNQGILFPPDEEKPPQEK
jgi:DNA polymerase III subunit alpha, Gram-positive type